MFEMLKNVKVSVLLKKKSHKRPDPAMLWMFQPSMIATEELQSCSTVLQIKSLKEKNMKLLYGALFHKTEIFDILYSLQMKAK